MQITNLTKQVIRLVIIEPFGYLKLMPNETIVVDNIYNIDNLEGLLDPTKNILKLKE